MTRLLCTLIMVYCLVRCTSAFVRQDRALRVAVVHVRQSTTAKQSSTLDTSTAATLPTVLLKRSQQSKAFRNGNQLVFTRAIKQIITTNNNNNQLQVADLCQVAVESDNVDQKQQNNKPTVLGWGVYNPDSLYKVRILCHRFLQPALHQAILKTEHAEEALTLVLEHHLQTALSLRRALQLPSEQTDTYRLIHGEGDGLSGLAIDLIANVAVIMSSAAWCQVHRNKIEASVKKVLPHHDIVWKTTPSRLEQDGYSSNEPVIEKDNDDKHQVISTENGIKYVTFPYADGQKTGVYCDQRENRSNLAKLCKGKRVLDLCCYHGGFSFNAVINGGALASVGVDSSDVAIETCKRNAELNGCSEEQVQFVRSDITEFLQTTKERFDVVVLDPPKLAPSVASLNKARRKYHSFNRDAIKVISDDGGLLLTCTCSAAMTQKDGGQFFLNMVQGAALAAGRQVTLLNVNGAAQCHTESPISWPAGAYLTAALFYVSPKV